jgi:hypothetical protein
VVSRRIAAARAPAAAAQGSQSRPLLTVVVPVYNGGEEIVENVGVSQPAVKTGSSGEEVEIVVVRRLARGG